jgi:hypothetical protein
MKRLQASVTQKSRYSDKIAVRFGGEILRPGRLAADPLETGAFAFRLYFQPRSDSPVRQIGIRPGIHVRGLVDVEVRAVLVEIGAGQRRTYRRP